MRSTLISLLAIFLTSLLYTSCKEKPVTTPGDLENPKIIMSSPMPVPLGSFVHLNSSDTFNIDIRFEDDKALKEYEIKIRYNRDLNYLKTTNDPWSESFYGSLDGVVDGVNFTQGVVWNPTGGPYTFTVKVTDEAGKTTENTTYLYVTNRNDPSHPQVKFTEPDTTVVDTYLIGQNVNIKAICLDPAGGSIRDVFLRIRDAFTQEVMGGSEIWYDTLYMNPVTIDTFVKVPAGTVPGDYNVEVYANDQTFNTTRGSDHIYIKPN